VTTATLRIGDVLLTRVSYAEIEVEPEQVGLTAEEVAAADAPAEWVTNDKPRASASAWIIDHAGARIVVDPAGAVDDILRNDDDAALHQEAFAALLEGAGYPRERITHAVATHLDGVGMLAWRNDDGSWVPFFPNAPIVMSQRELDAIDAMPFEPQGRKILAELEAQGAVQGTGEHEDLTEAVAFDFTGGHNPGHMVVRIQSGGEEAIMLGHLALTPLHVALQKDSNHFDPPVANERLRELLEEDATFIGPLWPAPAAGRWNGHELVPIAGG
jgi:glyoxylase-like metal-dependent hydrolase (beta-lactamase superfamily II)